MLSIRTVYRQYKLDTAAVSDWLAYSALSRGYVLVYEPRKRGSSRKSRDEGEAHTLSSKQYEALAAFLRSEGVLPSRSMRKTLERCIRGRQAIAQALSDLLPPVASHGAKDGHKAFIHTLQIVRDIFGGTYGSVLQAVSNIGAVIKAAVEQSSIPPISVSNTLNLVIYHSSDDDDRAAFATSEGTSPPPLQPSNPRANLRTSDDQTSTRQHAAASHAPRFPRLSLPRRTLPIFALGSPSRWAISTASILAPSITY